MTTFVGNIGNAMGKGLHSLNNSKFFAGLVMIMLNIGSKYITIKLSKSQEQYLQNTVARQMLIFAIIWMGTRDVLLSIGMTAAFMFLTDHFFNENSPYCVIPHHLRRYEEALDQNDDGRVTPEEVRSAIAVLEKMKKREHKRQQIRMLESFRSQL